MESALDDPARVEALRRRIREKPALEHWYRACYARFADCVARCPGDGAVLEIGSGGGFLAEVIPEVVTSDVLPYEGVDRVVDARALPFDDGALRAILMLNAFHHIPDVGAFLAEAERCLAPGGRLHLVDQHVGWLSRIILTHGHHEPFDDRTPDWHFPAGGPLSSANGALTWIVFQRDRARLAERHPRLALVCYRPHSPLAYFLAGGLKAWSLVPGFAAPAALALDAGLARLSSELCCFVDVELVREPEA